MEQKQQLQQEQLLDGILEFVQSYVAAQNDIKSEKIMQVASDETIARLRHCGIPEKGRAVKEVIKEMVEDIYSNQVIMQHPRWFGFVPSPASLLSWLGDIMTNAYDPHAGSWMQSSAATCIEQEVVAWMCRQAGYPNTSGGIFVSGGSMANLTALTAARNAKLSEFQYGMGTAYVSEQTHSSVSKGLRIIGLRTDQIRKIPTDSDFRMNIPLLKDAVSEDLAAGRIPFAIIANAGSTNTGSIDSFNEIADLCEKHHIWMHVDGAYGASVLASSKYRHRLQGIERGDSISWDAHKWLMQTYSCSAVLVKDKKTLTDSFHTCPEYLKDAAAEDDQINYWDLGPELTRPARSLKLWVTLQVLGSKALGDIIDHSFQLAEWAEDEIRKHAHWEIICPAQQAIVNFRYAPPGLSEAQLDTINQQISKEMLTDGYAGVLTTELKGRKVLRICALHPDADEADMRTTVQLLDNIARQLTKELKLERNAS